MTCKNLLDMGWYPQRKLNYSLDEVIDWYSHAIKKKYFKLGYNYQRKL